MNIYNISVKTVSKAELGLTVGNTTHIGLPEGYIKNWEKRQYIDTNLNIYFSKNKQILNVKTININDPITYGKSHEKAGEPRSPKSRSGLDEDSPKNNVPSMRDQIIYYYNQFMRGELTPYLFIVSYQDKNNLDAFLVSQNHLLSDYLKNNLQSKYTTRGHKSNEISSKLLDHSDSDFRLITNCLFKNKFKYQNIAFDSKDGDQTEEEVKRITTNPKARTGQHQFRVAVLDAYKNKCCISQVEYPGVIEANHIRPHKSEKDHFIQNGIPLRKDIHQLWTSGHLGINNNYEVVLSEDVLNSPYYSKFDKIKILLPYNKKLHPDKRLLSEHISSNPHIAHHYKKMVSE